MIFLSNTVKRNQSILAKIDEIVVVLKRIPVNREIGLYTGQAGISLFLLYYARFKKSKAIHQRAIEILEDIFTQIEDMQQPPFSLCSGIAGVGWLVDHLYRHGFIDGDANDMLSSIDEHLYRTALNLLSRGSFDFMHGAMGIVLYFVKRNRQDYLRNLVEALDRIATWVGDGAKWLSVIKHEEGISGYNIALSHGSSSIALVLCKVLQILPEDETAKRLLRGAITFIVNQEIPVAQYGCFFPGFSIESQPELLKTRLAWCYGDLGVGYAILQSGIILSNREWIERGLMILSHSATRRGLQENSVLDAGVCHGTAGIASIFNRLYLKTAREEFKEAAVYWCQETLSMAKFEDGFAGYKTWRTEKYGGWQTSTSLLEGVSGIGLCLLSFVTSDDPAWDECFLLS